MSDQQGKWKFTRNLTYDDLIARLIILTEENSMLRGKLEEKEEKLKETQEELEETDEELEKKRKKLVTLKRHMREQHCNPKICEMTYEDLLLTNNFICRCGSYLFSHRKENEDNYIRQENALLTESLFQYYSPEILFFVDDNRKIHNNGSETGSSDTFSIKLSLKCEGCHNSRDVYGSETGTQIPSPSMTRAHILSDNNFTEFIINGDFPRFYVDKNNNFCHYKSKNFLSLCGTLGSTPSCHHGFDSYRICFLHTPDEESEDKWIIITSDIHPYNLMHKKQTILHNGPYSRIMHAHAVMCIKRERISIERFGRFIKILFTNPDELDSIQARSTRR